MNQHPPPPAPIRLLLVEDNPGDARLFREYLRAITYTQFEITVAERLENVFTPF